MTAFAQGLEPTFERAYENALLDSLLKYEYLKPTYYSLTKSHEYLNKEYFGLRTENGLLQLQLNLQKQHYEGLLALERKKRHKGAIKAFLLGYATGKLTPPY